MPPLRLVHRGDAASAEAVDHRFVGALDVLDDDACHASTLP